MPKTISVSDGSKHTSDVNTLLFHKGKLYSGADDGKIKVWDEEVILLGTIDNAHAKSVLTMAASDDTLYSGSSDGTIKSWNLSDLKPKTIIANGQREIWKLFFKDDSLYVADDQGKVEVYSKEQLVQDFDVMDPIKDIVVIDNLIYLLQELDIVIRYLKSRFGDFERRKTIMASVPMCVAGDRLFFCSRDGLDIHMRDNSDQRNFKDISLTQQAHDARIHSLVGLQKGTSTLLFSGGGDKTVKQWKIEGKCLVKLFQCSLRTGVNVMTTGNQAELYVGCRDGFMYRLDF